VGLQPKDFDIATSALPRDMKRVFPRNCRVIGRRFKLAHLHFNGNTKILEAATFRRTPEGITDDGEDEDLLIVRDNLFGTAEEDAVRRDFTVNALFFDPIDDRIIDYCGGLADVQARVIRTIGDPETRFREDPVRILRAAKFAGRLGFTIDEPTYAAMKLVAPDLTRSAPPRMLEEILRLLRGGHALDSFQILRDVDALPVILPVVGNYLTAAEAEERVLFWRTLESLDNRVARGDRPSNPVLLGALFTRPLLALAAEPGRSPTTIAEEVIGPFALDLRLPRRDAGCLKRICGVQTRFTSTGRRRFRMSSFLRDGYFPQALELFELTCRASGEGLDQLEHWRRLYAEADLESDPKASGEAGDDVDVGNVTVDADASETRRSAPSEGRASDGRRPPRRKRRRRKKTSTGDAAAPANEEAKASDKAKNGDEEKDGDKPQRTRGRQTRGKKTKARKKAGQKTVTTAAGEEPSSGGRRKRKRSRGKAPTDADAKRGRGKTETPGRGNRDRSRGRSQDEVKTVEPEPVDVSAFDMELDPKRIPTFTTIVEGEDQANKKRRRPRVPREETDTYKPPPPPGGDQGDPPPPPPDDDVFGDW